MGNADITIDRLRNLQTVRLVWIDGGLHANEVVGIHQLIETAYCCLATDDEAVRILNDVIILLTHANRMDRNCRVTGICVNPNQKKPV
jgi:hypothetical protein